MKVVIPLAGKDPRFEGLPFPKALIPIEGKPLVKFCTDSLPYPFATENPKIYFVILKEHEDRFDFSAKLKALYPHAVVKILEKPTEGAACTVLTLKKEINSEEELLVYLADIYFKAKPEELRAVAQSSDGVIPCFKSSKKKYSYAIAGRDGKVSRVAEKEVISEDASCGFYFFKRGKDFVEGAEKMIAKNKRVNGAFFICPAYNELISSGKTIKIVNTEFIFDLGDEGFIKKYVVGYDDKGNHIRS